MVNEFFLIEFNSVGCNRHLSNVGNGKKLMPLFVIREGRSMNEELHVLTTKAEPERPDWLLYDASSAAHYHPNPQLDQSCLAALGKFSTVLPVITQTRQFVSRARRWILGILYCVTWWIVTYRRNLQCMKRGCEKGTSLVASYCSWAVMQRLSINFTWHHARLFSSWDSISEDWPSSWILPTFTQTMVLYLRKESTTTRSSGWLVASNNWTLTSLNLTLQPNA